MSVQLIALIIKSIRRHVWMLC